MCKQRHNCTSYLLLRVLKETRRVLVSAESKYPNWNTDLEISKLRRQTRLQKTSLVVRQYFI